MGWPGAQPTRSPWLAQITRPLGPCPLSAPTSADIVVVGAGIAGLATAFFALRQTDRRVLLLEAGEAATGATGHNASQLATYFERPLHSLVDTYGFDQAIAAQRAIDESHRLLDLMVAESGAEVTIERFQGHLAMFTANHVQVHLRNNQLRRLGGLAPEPVVISEQAPFLPDLAADLAGQYEVVPQRHVRDLLGSTDDQFWAVLSNGKGVANGALLVHQVIDFLRHRHPDRFVFADHTPVESVVVGDDGVVLRAGGWPVTANAVVLCTNAYRDHHVVDRAGRAVSLCPDQDLTVNVGYMAAFVEDHRRSSTAISYIRNTEIGGATPYVYVTRRSYDRDGAEVTLTCMGGPERSLPDHESYDPHGAVPEFIQREMDEVILPLANPARAPERPYDYAWHGLMAYTGSGVRIVGAHPTWPRLLYNLACNGVGFLPSVYGGERVGRLLAGERLEPSIFDPRA